MMKVRDLSEYQAVTVSEIKAALEDDSKMDEILATIGANKASFRLQALKSTKSL